MRFETFVTGQAAALLRHATIVSADPHQAPDLVQAVLERALARWAKIDDLDRPDLYVRRMVVNEFLSVRRRWRRIYPTDVVPEPEPAPDIACGVVLRDTMIVAIRTLPPRERVVVALRYWSGMKDAEIAAQLGCTESTVRGYHLRAMRRLRAAIGAPGPADAEQADTQRFQQLSADPVERTSTSLPH